MCNSFPMRCCSFLRHIHQNKLAHCRFSVAAAVKEHLILKRKPLPSCSRRFNLVISLLKNTQSRQREAFSLKNIASARLLSTQFIKHWRATSKQV